MNGIELVASWLSLSPTVLFCVLNLMIGTVFISSILHPHRNQQNLGDQHRPRQGLVPSLLERVKSFNFSRNQPDPPPHSTVAAQEQEELHHATRSVSEKQQNVDESNEQHRPELGRVPSFLERVKSFNLSGNQPDPPPHSTVAAQEQEELHHVTRSVSDTVAKTTAPPSRMLKKSASEKVSAEKREMEVDERRPATVRERTAAAGDEAVDAKADDFISRFRQQLKLQRMDSILRRKEMPSKETGK